MARRQRQAQHVGERARVPVGDGAAQLQDLRREHLLAGHDAAQRHEPAVVVGGLLPRDDVPGDVLPPEPGLDPHAGLRVVGHRGGDQVVVRLVEVRGLQVEHDPRHRERLGDGDAVGLGLVERAPPLGRAAAAHGRGAHLVQPEQHAVRQRVLLRVPVHAPIPSRATDIPRRGAGDRAERPRRVRRG